jgi:hypothetical protein
MRFAERLVGVAGTRGLHLVCLYRAFGGNRHYTVS